MFGSNYYAATLLLPRAIRDDVFIFYAFVRLADEIVDNPVSDSDPTTELQTFCETWRSAYTTKESNNAVLNAFADVCHRHAIPLEYIDAFLFTMQQDLHKSRYDTYADLEGYMYGSAEVIGLILLPLFGCTNESAATPARALGKAMQLTNFLRDVYEDYHERNRVYLPQEDLLSHGATESSLTEIPSPTTVRDLIRFEVSRARTLYQEAQAGIKLLPPNIQPAVRAATALYSELLTAIEKRDFAISTTKFRLSRLKKLQIALLYGYVKK